MIQEFSTLKKHRLTQAEKEADNFAWYRERANHYDKLAFGNNSTFFGVGGISTYMNKKVNYDLFNNRLRMADLEYVCKPFGEGFGELPAMMVNRDIVSQKIKVLLGMEMSMPFSWKVFAVNPEAITRRRSEEFDRIREFVSSSVLKPLENKIRASHAQELKGKKLSQQELQQIEEEIQQELQAQTPDQTKMYMQRNHRDAAEVQGTQILQYLWYKEKIAKKFNKGWKHSLLGGEETYAINIFHDEPSLEVINDMRFNRDRSVEFTEDGQWAVCEYSMSPSEFEARFGEDLTEEEIKRLYDFDTNRAVPGHLEWSFETENPELDYQLRVRHIVWKASRKVGFLTYMSPITGKEELTLVNETYVLRKDQGDIHIDWKWIPEVHESWKTLDDIYVRCRPFPGQHRDIDTLYVCKLPYYGAAHDSMNSAPTSPMDRIKMYQYLYNIILYRIELLMASDKGKIIAANIKALPKSAGIDTKKFTYFMEANKIAWFNPNEEGNKNNPREIGNIAQVLDLSLVQDINNYIQFAEYIERKCGEAIGVTKPMEGAAGPEQSVGNNRQNIVQASHIVRPYFDLHNTIKENALNALLDLSRVAYANGKKKYLTYVLDDMSYHTLTINPDLLSESSLGIFVANNARSMEIKQAIEGLSHTALQNQQATLKDIISIMKQDDITQAEEILQLAEDKAHQNQMMIEKQKADFEAKLKREEQANKEAEWEHDERMIVLKEKERRKTELQKQAMLSIGFNEDKDIDDDGELDVMEVFKLGQAANIANRKLALEERSQQHKEEVDNQKLELENKKIKQMAKKKASN